MNIVELAKQAGFELDCCSLQWHERIERFARLVYNAALEEAANVCEIEARQHEHLDHNGRSRHLDDAFVAKTCAASIQKLIND